MLNLRRILIVMAFAGIGFAAGPGLVANASTVSGASARPSFVCGDIVTPAVQGAAAAAVTPDTC